MVAQLIRSVESEQFKKDIPSFGAGDTVRVHAKVVEGNRERIQVFEGVVIRRRSGGINENFTVRRIASHAIGVERTFLIHSPRIDKIEVVRHGRVRRAKLYYLRGLTGKAARIKERRRPLIVTSATNLPVTAAQAAVEEIEEQFEDQFAEPADVEERADEISDDEAFVDDSAAAAAETEEKP